MGVWRDDKVEIIPNDMGNRTTPSVVAFTESHRLIGEAAKAQITSNPTNTVFDAKRLIGRKYSDQIVQNDLKHWPFKLIADENDKPLIEVSYLGKKQQFTCGMWSIQLIIHRTNLFYGIIQDETNSRIFLGRKSDQCDYYCACLF